MSGAKTTPACLAGIRHIIPREVAWGDMDAMRHVNNTRYFFYCETARIEFFRELDPNLTGDGPETVTTLMALAEVGCRFKLPLTHPDNLLVATFVDDIQETQFLMRHLIYSERLDCVAAEATARAVSFDITQNKRVPIPDESLVILQRNQRSE